MEMLLLVFLEECEARRLSPIWAQVFHRLWSNKAVDVPGRIPET